MKDYMDEKVKKAARNIGGKPRPSEVDKLTRSDLENMTTEEAVAMGVGDCVFADEFTEADEDLFAAASVEAMAEKLGVTVEQYLRGEYPR